MAQNGTLSIGELGARVGLTPDALRYYERLGLITPSGRTTGGFRVYAADAVERLQFIKQAQVHGLTLAEIRELMRLDDTSGTNQCRQVRELLQRKLADVDQRLVRLKEFRRALAGYLTQCDNALGTSPTAPCPVVVRMRRVKK